MRAVIYDGTDLGELMHAECARPLMASPKVSTSTSAGRDGFEVSSVRLESFDVDVECYVLPGWPLDMADGIREASDAKRLIASALFRKGKRKLIFDDDPAMYCMAIVSGVSDVTRVGYVDYFTVTFTCDPLFLSNEERSQDLPRREGRRNGSGRRAIRDQVLLHEREGHRAGRLIRQGAMLERVDGTRRHGIEEGDRQRR